MKKSELDKIVENFSIEQALVFFISGFTVLALFAKSYFNACIVVSVIALILICILSFPSVKGKIGEGKVIIILNRIIKKHDGYIINDVIIPNPNGTTSQIDHILFLESGIYVIETKNYAGRIYGNDNQEKWTQVLQYGNVKKYFYSPVKQNQTHIYCLKEIIKNDINYENVVCFVNNNTNYIDSTYVYKRKELRHINFSKKLIDKEELFNIYTLVNKYKTDPIVSNRQHVKNINNTIKKIDNNICPRCGGNLVLRTSKDSNQFYGCSNYPKCTFTKKIDK